MDSLSSRLQRNSPSLQGAVNKPEYSPVPLSRTDIKIPLIDLDLILHLRAVFSVSVSAHNTIRDYDIMVGHQQVIEYLERLHSEQETK